MSEGYKNVTEIAGELISEEQLDRAYTRYKWAQGFCEGKDVLEVACGVGQGLGLLHKVAKSLIASDIDNEILDTAKNTIKIEFLLRSFLRITSLLKMIHSTSLLYLKQFTIFKI